MQRLAILMSILFSMSAFAVDYTCNFSVGEAGAESEEVELQPYEGNTKVRVAELKGYLAYTEEQNFKLPDGSTLTVVSLNVEGEDIELSGLFDGRQIEDGKVRVNDPGIAFSNEDINIMLSCSAKK